MRPFVLCLLVGCYTPDTRDCTVACSQATDCVHGQSCSSQGFCTSPGVQCASPDATPVAMTQVALHVMIDGKGRVTVDSVGTCASDNPTHGDCTYHVPSRVTRSLVAAPLDEGDFAGWTTSACSGQDATCTLVPVSATTEVKAKFK